MLRTTVAAFGAGRRWSRHRAGAAVRRRDPGWIARHRRRVSPAGSPATPSCCCWRSRTSAGCSTRPAAPGTSRTSPKALPRRPGRTSRTSRRAADSSTARDHVAEQIDAGARPPGRRHRAPPHRASPVSTNSRTSPKPPLPPAVDPDGGRALRGGVRSAARPLRCLPGDAPVPGPRRCCCRWGRWPSTTSGPPSPRTCWPPAASRPSTPAPSTPAAVADAVRDAGAAVAVICGTDARYGTRGRPRSSRPPAPPGVEQVCLAGPEKAVADVPPSAGPTTI